MDSALHHSLLPSLPLLCYPLLSSLHIRSLLTPLQEEVSNSSWPPPCRAQPNPLPRILHNVRRMPRLRHGRDHRSSWTVADIVARTVETMVIFLLVFLIIATFFFEVLAMDLHLFFMTVSSHLSHRYHYFSASSSSQMSFVILSIFIVIIIIIIFFFFKAHLAMISLLVFQNFMSFVIFVLINFALL